MLISAFLLSCSVDERHENTTRARESIELKSTLATKADKIFFFSLCCSFLSRVFSNDVCDCRYQRANDQTCIRRYLCSTMVQKIVTSYETHGDDKCRSINTRRSPLITQFLFTPLTESFPNYKSPTRPLPSSARKSGINFLLFTPIHFTFFTSFSHSPRARNLIDKSLEGFGLAPSNHCRWSILF